MKKGYFIAISLLLCALLPSNMLAQSTATGHTPSGFATGFALGSQSLNDVESINYYNGGLNFVIPLLRAQGRSSAGYTIMLPIESRWSVEQEVDPNFGELYYRPIYNDWLGRKPGYSPGILLIRRVIESGAQCAPVTSVKATTRLTFIAAGNTETELVDTTYNGSLQWSGCEGGPITSRGTTFTARDGSAMTFISDSPINDWPSNYTDAQSANGWLLFKDGTRYRIESARVVKIQDRNGNYISLQYTSVLSQM